MDGINGITGLYTLVVLLSLGYINQYIQPFVDINFILYPIVASLVFLFFNFRKEAKCFAGDVGSIAIAFWLVYLILMLIIKTNSIIWILLLAVYGTDTVCTIMHRLYLRENIFEAHRHHFYQILSNDYKIDHRVVASFYAILQMITSLSIFYLKDKVNIIMLFVVILMPILLIYLSKFYLIKRLNTK
jgi:UDP-N-acetylmuramyl pentapeptide phosphotransferase/UDP-N-acetylglucosamine-1-phosphate transferase